MTATILDFTPSRLAPPLGTLPLRERILNAATAAFSSAGFEQATLAQIAAHAGTRVGELRALFYSKQDLLEAVLRDLASMANAYDI